MPRPAGLIGGRLSALTLAATLACTALLATVTSTITAPAAQAFTEGSSVDVVIDEMTPLIAREGSTLTVSGRLLNLGAVTLESVSIRLRTSSEPLDARQLIEDIADAPMNPNAPYDNRYYDRTRESIGTLAPGAQAPFTIRLPIASLRLPAQGTYTLSVEALGRDPQADEFEERKGIQRTFLPWFPQPGKVAPIGITWLWPLADWPARDADGSFIDDRTPRELAPGGRLRDLVDVVGAAPGAVTWVADPELLQAAAVIARGYSVLRDGVPVVGDRSPDAQAWLDTLTRALRGRTLQVLPYADVDAGALRRAGLSDDVIRSITTAPQVAGSVVRSPVAGGLAWAPAGRFDKQSANLLATAGVRTVVLDGSAMPPADELAVTPSGIANYGTAAGPIDAVLVDQGLARTLALPQSTAAEALAARQRFLAHTAMIAMQQGADPGRVIVAAPADLRWDPDPRFAGALLRALQSAPWMRPASLEQLTAAARTPRTREAYGDAARDAELTERYVTRVQRSQERLDRFVSVLVDPAGVAQAYGSAILRAASSAWRTEPDTANRLLTSINGELSARIGLIRALSSGTVTFSGDSGRVPVTVANDGPDAVVVGVQLIGEPASRLVSTPHEPITIEPGRKASLDLDARVIGGDPLTVRVQLLTPEGEAFGEPETITLGSTAYARAAAWVVGLAFVAIAVFVVVGITRRISKVRRAASANGGTGSDTVSS